MDKYVLSDCKRKLCSLSNHLTASEGNSVWREEKVCGKNRKGKHRGTGLFQEYFTSLYTVIIKKLIFIRLKENTIAGNLSESTLMTGFVGFVF